MTILFHSRRGSALLVVLGMLAFMLFSGLAFSVYMRQSRLPTSFLRRTSTTRQLAKAALAEAIEDIDRAIGNDVHPNIRQQSYSEGELGNFWKNRIFVGEGTTTNPEGQNASADPGSYYPALVGTDETVPTLTLEGLAYLPPNLINEARYYSQRTPTAKWHSFWFDSGRYAYTAIDVSDYFDVNRVFADKPRSSSPMSRITFSHLFEEGIDHSASGSGASAWDSFMEPYRQVDKDGKEKNSPPVPFISLADFNIAFGAQRAGFSNPFQSFVRGGQGKPYPGTDGGEDDPEAEKYRYMTFVTDGWFPMSNAEYVPNSSPKRRYKDLADYNYNPFSPLTMDALNTQRSVGFFSEFSGKLIGHDETDKPDLFNHLCGLNLAQLWDYIDENRVPVSLAIPTLERVPMVVGIEPELPQIVISAEQVGTDILTTPTPGPGAKKTCERTIEYKIKILGDPSARVLLAYPFRNHEIERSGDSFSIDGRLALFLTDNGEEMSMRVGSANTALHVSSPNSLATDSGFVNNSVITIALKSQNSSISPANDFADENNPPVKAFDLRGNNLNSLEDGTLICRATYKWTTEAWDPNAIAMNGSKGDWSKDYDDAHADPTAQDIKDSGVQKPTQVGFSMVKADGSPVISSVPTLINYFSRNATDQKVKVNAAVWVRVLHNDAFLGNKTVDLVPASAYDDRVFNGVNNDEEVSDTWRRVFVSDGYPLLRYDVAAVGGSANAGEIPLSFSHMNTLADPSASHEESYTLEVHEPGGSQPRNPKIVINDPRYNHLPENWYFSPYQTTSQLAAEDWTSETGQMLGSEGRDGDLYMATSDQGVLQSVYELAFLPRLTGMTQNTLGNSISAIKAGGLYSSQQKGSALERKTFGTSAGDAADYNTMWRTFRCYDVGDLRADPFEEIGLTSGEGGQKVNPYSDSLPVLMAALANTPRDWRVAYTNCELKASGGVVRSMTAQAFNESCAWNGYSGDSDCQLPWQRLKAVAQAIKSGVRPLDAGETWEDVFATLKWHNADPSQFMGSNLGSTKLYDVDRKFLYGFWHDSFAARQQLFLIFIRAEPMMMGGGVTGQAPPQLGARAVALVWRDPTPTAQSDDTDGEGSATRYCPHRTRILFYHQFD